MSYILSSHSSKTSSSSSVCLSLRRVLLLIPLMMRRLFLRGHPPPRSSRRRSEVLAATLQSPANRPPRVEGGTRRALFWFSGILGLCGILHLCINSATPGYSVIRHYANSCRHYACVLLGHHEKVYIRLVKINMFSVCII